MDHSLPMSSRRQVLRLLGLAPLGAIACGDDGSGRSDLGGASDLGSLGDASLLLDGSELCLHTSSDALGPFFENGAPNRSRVAGPGEPGQRLLFAGVLADQGCAPLAGLRLDLWQADLSGNYYDATADFRLRGHLVTGDDGAFAFDTVVPGNYETAAGPRPAHLHLRVAEPDGRVRLVTQIYFAGDPNLGIADGCQPPTCFSSDADRILELVPMGDLFMAETRLVV